MTGSGGGSDDERGTESDAERAGSDDGQGIGSDENRGSEPNDDRDETADADGGGRIRLLHVDDDEGARMHLESVVERAYDDVEITGTADPDDAQAALEPGSVDALVVDQEAPGVDAAGLAAAADAAVVLYTDARPDEIDPDLLDAADTLVEKWTADEGMDFVAEKIVGAARASAGPGSRLQRAFDRSAVDPPRTCQFLVYEDGTVVWRRTSLASFLERRGVDDAVPETPNFYRKLTALLSSDPRAIRTVRESSVTADPMRFALPTGDGEAVFRYAEHEFPETFGPVRLVAIEDVTVRAREEARSELLELFDERVRDGVSVVDADGRIEYHNEAFASLLGVDDMVGDHAAAYMDGESLEAGQRAVQRLLASDRDGGLVDVTFETDDGERRELAVHFAGRESDGGYDGLVNVARDVTERRDRERDLERYRRLVETAVDPMFVADGDDRITCCNEAMATLFYAAESSLVGTRLPDLLPAEGVERLASAGERAAETGESATCEVRLSGAAATDRLFEASVAPLPGDGESAGTVGVLRDVTDRERRESELDLLKQVLTRVLRHDVRTGLTVIRGQAEVLAERTGGEEREMAETILARSEELVQTTEKVRAIERVIDGDDGSATLDLRTTVNRAVANVAAAYPDAEYDVRITGRVPVTVHRAFPYAVENLIENAVEHSSTNPDSQARQDAVEHSSTSPGSQARRDAGRASSSEPSVANAPEDAVEHGSASPDDPSTPPEAGDNPSPMPPSNGTGEAVESAPRTSRPERPRAGETPRVTITASVEAEYVELNVADDGPGIDPTQLEVLDRGEETPLKHGSGVGLWLVDWVVERSGGDVLFDTGADGTTVIVRLARGDPGDLGSDADAE